MVVREISREMEKKAAGVDAPITFLLSTGVWQATLVYLRLA